MLEDVFPLKINKNKIKLDTNPVEDLRILNSREVTFTGTYKNVKISCICAIVFGDIEYHSRQYYYGYKMSQQLLACRNMANYFGVFESHVSEITQFFTSPPKESALFIIKPYFKYGTLNSFMKLKKKKEKYVPPLQMLQMSITLFSMLSDAHAQGIGLVNINMNNLHVSLDGGLYFDGFQSCMPLNTTFLSLERAWVDTKTIKCPEALEFKKQPYKLSADIFQATLIMLELTKGFSCTFSKLYKINQKENSVKIKDGVVDEHFLHLIPMFEKCLHFNPEERPSASQVLHWLESLRYQSLLAADV